MKVSDYIVSFFESHHIKYIFGYQGGMITHLVDSISKNNNVKYVQCYHEQTAAIAAEGYARVSGIFGVAISTSGPGATNMITGIANAFFDSIPVIYITGQVNSYEYKYHKMIRQQGFQETDIVSVVKPITKYATMIDSHNQIKYELEKAIHIATTDRKGPVLLDIPMNIQRADIIISDIPSFNNIFSKPYIKDSEIKEIIDVIQKAERPLVLCGGGIITNNSNNIINNFLNKTNLPYVVSLMGKGSVDETNEKFIGMIGSYGNRCANIILSNADIVLVLGSRLDLRQIGDKNMEYLKKILFIHVDIDKNELIESNIENKKNIYSDLYDFIKMFLKYNYTYNNQKWDDFIYKYKEAYSQKNDINHFVDNKEPYTAIEKIMNVVDKDVIYTVDIGQNQMWSSQVIKLKSNQRFLTSGGLAPMGYALNAAIGASFASPERQIVCIIGDGGFHIAIQALMLISQYKLNIKIFILNNHALGMITQFQTMYFQSNMAGTTKEGGYYVPNFEYFAKACNLKYSCIFNILEKQLPNINDNDVIEIKLNGLTSIVPKLEYNQPLYNMYPYLNNNEITDIK